MVSTPFALLLGKLSHVRGCCSSTLPAGEIRTWPNPASSGDPTIHPGGGGGSRSNLAKRAPSMLLMRRRERTSRTLDNSTKRTVQEVALLPLCRGRSSAFACPTPSTALRLVEGDARRKVSYKCAGMEDEEVLASPAELR
eukprot:scaffold215341_cov30-Tisochrysis_lutea.AAC.10